MQVWMKGDFTRVRWQGCWIGEHDRDGDTLYLGDQGPGSVSIDSNTKDIWKTVIWFLVGGLAWKWVSQLLWLSSVSTRLAVDLAANLFPRESYPFGSQHVRISHSVWKISWNHHSHSFCLLEFQIHFLVFKSLGWTLKEYFKARQFMLILPALKKKNAFPHQSHVWFLNLWVWQEQYFPAFPGFIVYIS